MWLVWQRTLLLSTTCSTKSPFLSSAFSPYLSASFEASPLLFWKAIGCSPFLVTSSFHWPNESFTSLVLLSWMSESRNGFSSNKRPVRKKKKKNHHLHPSVPICFSDLSVSDSYPYFSGLFCLKRFLQNTSKAGSPALPSTSRQPSLPSPKPGAEFPKAAKMSIPQRPRLGTGFSEGEDILFFDGSPPPTPKLDSLAEAKKVTALWMSGFWLWRRGS